MPQVDIGSFSNIVWWFFNFIIIFYVVFNTFWFLPFVNSTKTLSKVKKVLGVKAQVNLALFKSYTFK